jgi:hypothetical protein
MVSMSSLHAFGSGKRRDPHARGGPQADVGASDDEFEEFCNAILARQFGEIERHSDGTITIRNRLIVEEEGIKPRSELQHEAHSARSRRYYERQKPEKPRAILIVRVLTLLTSILTHQNTVRPPADLTRHLTPF